jgi:chemotaxis signal transduction protein
VEEFITFRVAKQDFAMESARVRGLLPLHQVIPVEAAETWISGIASMRGRDFPVIDLRARLKLPNGSPGRQPCVVVVEVDGEHLLGFVADRISQLVKPRARDFVDGMLRVKGRLRRLLDPDRMITAEERLDFSRLTTIP